MKDERPIRQRCYRQTAEAKAEIRRQIESLKRNKLVEPTQTLFNSSIILLKKSNGSFRMCIDFRKVNQATFPQFQPLVSINEIVNVFGEWRPKIFSTLDRFSGYHQVCIDPNSKKCTAFTTPDGEHLQYNRLAFGLSNAPAHFMHAMQTLFQHSKNRYYQVYLDDIIIFSPNARQHTVQLRDTLNVIRRAGLKLNPAKCSFAQLKVKYLGHWFSGDGYGMDQKLLKLSGALSN